MNPLIVPSYRIWTYGVTASGPIEPTYQLAWAGDANSARPLHAGATTAAWDMALGSKTVNFLALINHNVSVNATVTGVGTSKILIANAIPVDEILDNPFLFFTNVNSVGTVNYSITSNPNQVIVGELIAAQAYQLARPFPPGTDRTPLSRGVPRDDAWGMWPGYDENALNLIVRVSFTVQQADFDELLNAYRAQRGNSLPSILVHKPASNDCLFGFFTDFRWAHRTPHEYDVSFGFVELSKNRWP